MSPARRQPNRRGLKGAPAGLERLRRRLHARRAGDDGALFAEIARQLVQRREAWGLSQRELAGLCGTTQSAIARLERGERPPRIDTLRRVGSALDCDLKVELRPRTRTAGH